MITKIAKAAVVAVVAGSLNLGFAAPAGATPVGRDCGFTSVTDPTVENGRTQVGQINGGPVGDDAQAVAGVTIACTIQIGADNSTHAGADAFRLSGSGIGTASVAGMGRYVSPEGQPTYLCTEVTVNGATYYRDSANATWSTNPGVGCADAISQEVFPGPLDPVLDTPPMDSIVLVIDGVATIVFDVLNQLENGIVDPLICPALTIFFPPDGDVGVFYDCPPDGR